MSGFLKRCGGVCGTEMAGFNVIGGWRHFLAGQDSDACSLDVEVESSGAQPAGLRQLTRRRSLEQVQQRANRPPHHLHV